MKELSIYKKMNMQNEKAQAFVRRLLQNPALTGLTPLQQEEQIIQFLAKNGSQLYPTLSSPNFFSGANWEQIWTVLNSALITEINSVLLPELQRIVEERIDFSFVSFLRQQSVPQSQIKQEVYSLLSRLIQKPEVRRGFTGPFTALYFNTVEKYIEKVMARKEYIHFELTKVQRLAMGKDEIKHMIHASIIFRPIIHILSLRPGDGVGAAAGQYEKTAGTIQTQYAEKVLEIVMKNLKTIPEEVIRSAVNSNVSFLENKFIEATARITALFSSRCREYNPAVKVDRGADSPDKSWFSVARRNFKFYGYDIKMIDEFYKIAAENGW